jgi:hypothetical protein
VIGRLPIPFTDDKRPKEKELDGSARQKVKHGQRKMLTVRSPAHALPPAPSASKQLESYISYGLTLSSFLISSLAHVAHLLPIPA